VVFFFLFVFCFVFLRYSKENQLISLFSLPGAVAAQEEVEERQSWLLHAPPPRPAEPDESSHRAGFGGHGPCKGAVVGLCHLSRGESPAKSLVPSPGWQRSTAPAARIPCQRPSLPRDGVCTRVKGEKFSLLCLLCCSRAKKESKGDAHLSTAIKFSSYF